MNKSNETTHYRRALTRKLIDDMLKQRQKMLVLLWEIMKTDLHHVDEASKEILDDFSSILVDYIAAGHFGLYQRIVEGNERRSAVLAIAKDIYPRIAETTETAVAFSDRFESTDDKTINQHLTIELSQLAEEITVRIELEDQLIEAMLSTEPKLAVVST